MGFEDREFVKDQKIYNTVFEALARMKLPDFSCYDRSEVREAMHHLWGRDFRFDTENQEYLSDQVSRLSGGSVCLRQGNYNPETFETYARLLIRNCRLEKQLIFTYLDDPYFEFIE